MSCALFIAADRNRHNTFDIAIADADGETSIVAANDIVRIKIGAAEAVTPLLEITSAAPTSEGSTVTAANPARLNLARLDLQFLAGIWDIEAAIIDTSDGGKIKKISKGVFHLRESMGGGIN